VLVTLRALAPVELHGAALALQVFEGACHTR